MNTSTTTNPLNNSTSATTSTTFTKDDRLGVRMEARPVTSVSTRSRVPAIRGMASSIIREEPWTLDNMMNRRNFVGTFPVPANQPAHSIVGSLRVPEDLITNGLTDAPFKNFVYWRGKIIIEVQITGVPQIQGCLAVTWIPLTEATTYTKITQNFSALSVNQTSYLFPNANTNAIIEIPFNSPVAYLDIERKSPETYVNTLGHLVYTIFNPLELGETASDTCSVSTFCYFEDNQFKVPRRTGVTTNIRAKAQSLVSPVTADPPAKGKTGGFINKIIDSIMPENIIGDAIDVAAGFIGLDNPIIPTTSPRNKVISTQPMNFSSGGERIDSLTYNPSVISSTDQDTFATLEDEMHIKYLTSKYSYLGTFTMSNTQQPGTVLASFPMNPCPVRLESNQLTDVPLLSYVSFPFGFYTGGLTYKGQIVSTSFQTGKILISLNYNEFTPSIDGVTVSDASQYATIIEINQGSNLFEFTAPYIAQTPKLYVPSSNIPSASDSMGMVNVTVLNPLINQNGTPAQISINLFIAGADDFKLDTLTIANNIIPVNQSVNSVKRKKVKYVREASVDSYVELIKLPSLRARSQASAQPLITPMSNVDMATESVISPEQTTSTAVRSDVSQAHAPNVRDILRKYQMMSSVNTAAPEVSAQGGILTVPLADFFGVDSLDGQTPKDSQRVVSGLFSHFQMLYRQFKGGLNFKIMADGLGIDYSYSIFYSPPVQNQTENSEQIINTLGNSLYISPDDPGNYNGRTAFTAVPLATRLPINYVNGIDKTAEFNIPYSSKFLSILSRLGPGTEEYLENNDVTDLGSLHIYVTNPSPSTRTLIRLNIFMGIGDDARFGTLFNVPTVAPLAIVDEDGLRIGNTYPDIYDNSNPIVNTLSRP